MIAMSFRPVTAGGLLFLSLGLGCSDDASPSLSDAGGTTSGAAGSTSGGDNGAGTSNAGASTSSSGSGGSAAGGVGGSNAGGSTGGSPAAGGSPSGGSPSGGSPSGGGTGPEVPECEVNELEHCSVGDSVSCHFGGDPGNYEVTVTLGGAEAAQAYVEAESYRRVLGEVTTGAGEMKRFDFLVNVRQPEGQPVQNGATDGTPGLDIYLRGDSPKLESICFEPAVQPVTIWIAGDSTVCDQGGTDYSGWGQHLPQFFDASVVVANYADSGESSGSFLGNAKMWGAIKAGWTEGDWLFVQMGHNDKTTSAATFRANMASYVTQAKAAGVHVVLVTPFSRVGYALESQHVNSTGADLPKIIRDLGASEGVPVVDLTVTTWSWLETINWKDYFALGTDRTHPNPRGAEVIAGFVREAIQEQDLDIAAHLR